MGVEALSFRKRERLLLNGLLHEPAADTACADFHPFGAATWKCHTNSLKIGAKLTTCLSGNLCTDTAEILRFTASFNAVAHLRTLATNFTNTSHDESRITNLNS